MDPTSLTYSQCIAILLTVVLLSDALIVQEHKHIIRHHHGQKSLEPDGEPSGSENEMLDRNLKMNEDEGIPTNWTSNSAQYCGGTMTVYSNTMFYFTNIYINSTSYIPTSRNNSARLLPGFYQVPCFRKPMITFPVEMMYLPHWYSSSTFSSYLVPRSVEVMTSFTIALSRYEHLNVYWTLMDIYDVFLTMKFFKGIPEETSILLVDSHPGSKLDGMWKKLFFSVTSVSELPQITQYKQLIWNSPRTKSPMLQKYNKLPHQSQFRHFVLCSYNINPNYKPMCNVQHVYNILFVWRHDYESYPGKGTRRLARKISNEQDLLATAAALFPHSHIQGVQLDSQTLYTQLSLLSTTDILIGMHGAALSYSMFLPPGAAMIELFPLTQSENWHMEYIARWSHVNYLSWRNEDPSLQDFVRDTTEVPVAVISSLLRDVIVDLCKHQDIDV